MKKLLAMTAALTLSGCGLLDVLSPDVQASTLQCMLNITEQVQAGELERGSAEYQAAVTACTIPGVTTVVIDTLIESSVEESELE